MAPPEPGDPSNPFQSLLGDLMKMLGSQGPEQWETTRAFAINVATGGTAEANVDPVQRLQVEQLSQIAAMNVAEATGLSLTTDGRSVVCVPVGRAEWTTRALTAWRPLLEAMAPTPTTPPMPGTALDPRAEDDGMAGFAGLLGQWSAVIGPMLFGLQVGSVIGHLAQRTLGQYPLSLPWTTVDELVLVPENIAAFAEDWSLPADETLLWVSARELAAHAVMSRPAVRERFTELLDAMATSAAQAHTQLAERLSGMLGGNGFDALSGDGLASMDLEAMQGMFGDPEALLGQLLTPEAQRSSEQLTSLAVVVDAFADHIATVVGTRLVGSHSLLSEAWYRRRTERGKGEEAAGALFGLDLDQVQVDRGRTFVAGVLERAGEEGLARLWQSGANLPTPAEVDAPGLWLERISLPELDPPTEPNS